MLKSKSKTEANEYDALLAKIWQKQEGQKIDYKEPFLFSKDKKKEMYGLVKDILAMANTEGGGFIVIGREDNGGKGVPCSEDIIKSFDPTRIHKQTKKFGKPEPIFSVNYPTSPEGTKAVLINVAEFEEHVIICTDNAHSDSNKILLQTGTIYIRSKTGDAESTSVQTEQDMRCLIQRSILKSQQKLTDILEGVLGDFVHGRESRRLLRDDSAVWKNEISELSSKLDAELPLRGHMLQVVAYPTNYDAYVLENGKTIKERLLASVGMHRGWSFPSPDFELREIQVSDKTDVIVQSSSRRFLEGEHRTVVGMGVTGLVMYREELSTYYDEKTTPGKPLLMGWPLLSVYRAIDFFGRFYKFVSPTEGVNIIVLFTDTHNRYPASEVSQLNHLRKFFIEEPLPVARVKVELELERNELTTNPNLSYFKFLKRMLDDMGVYPTDEQLQAEVGKIAKFA